MLFTTLFSISAESRIRNRKVKEAKKVCKLMQEDALLSRDGKKVFGTERHSLVIESLEEEPSVSLIKDKGEKICQWPLQEWNSILKQNQVENLITFKYHIDEFKEVIIPYAQKSDGKYFTWNISLKDCDLNNHKISEKLDLPKCETPKKRSKRGKKSKSGKK